MTLLVFVRKGTPLRMLETKYHCTKNLEEAMIDRRSYAHDLRSCEIKAPTKSGLNVNRTHDLCDTGGVLHQLTSQVTGSRSHSGFVIYP